MSKRHVLFLKSLRTITRLVIFWSALLVYGAVKVLQGAIPLQRAMPAGAALLFFIGLFGWSIYRSKRDKKSEPTSLL